MECETFRIPKMTKQEPFYDTALSLQFGLDTERFDVAVDKSKGTGGRKVIIRVHDKKSGRHLVDAASGRMTKEALDRHAERIACELAKRLLDGGTQS
jgi:hypothetical protein